MLQIFMRNYNIRYKRYTDEISKEFIVLIITSIRRFVKIYQICISRSGDSLKQRKIFRRKREK